MYTLKKFQFYEIPAYFYFNIVLRLSFKPFNRTGSRNRKFNTGKQIVLKNKFNSISAHWRILLQNFDFSIGFRDISTTKVQLVRASEAG